LLLKVSDAMELNLLACWPLRWRLIIYRRQQGKDGVGGSCTSC